ncbi:hypothetical protein [Pseudodonghicola flavimaris]|uniref:Class I SAM-dependent methyltransferase n=1 Tax=Pseudodonghicola flavimaris TaxID=3050036 RepID=A0ABT7F178_9RHOB|nr:hypothetical protein [Pseudodonghicola flavimaris]MDK3018348.1 hypothetical protein [Pseudodonghicola flavimaris]
MPAAAAHIDRPVLTLPAPEAEALRTAYEAAEVILEYGSGGSTVLAAEMPRKHVTSVESDRKWAKMMQGWFADNPPAAGTKVDIHWSDIGKTRDWGHPKDESDWRKFPDYPLKIWGKKGFRHPDVVLVDGRFRIGCALATAFSITRPVTLLFDDYTHRSWFSRAEEFLGTPQIIGRMAAFDVTPQPVPPDRLLQVIKYMTRP